MKRYIALCIALSALSAVSGAGYAQTLGGPSACGQLMPEGSSIEGYGPYDYTNPVHRSQKLPIVEQYHFTPDVESLRKGSTVSVPGPDIGYTLWAFPNHHRALVSLINLSLREKTNHVRHMQWSVECYFDRAMRFKPNDKRVPMLYGFYLMKLNKYKDALRWFGVAEEGLQGDPNFHYNYGLLYTDLQQWDKAVEQAALAYSGGFTLPGLKNKLQRAGKWELVETRMKAKKTDTAEPSSDASKSDPPINAASATPGSASDSAPAPTQ